MGLRAERIEPTIWAPSLLLTLIGLGASSYLTVEHFSDHPSYACPASSTINCLKVTSSSYSHVGPAPVAVLGLIFFAAMFLLCLPPTWRVRALDLPRIALAGVGILTALYLVWAELFKIGAICLWCTAVHVVSLVLLGTVLWASSELRTRDR